MIQAQPHYAALVGPDESVNQHPPLNAPEVPLTVHHQLHGLLGEARVGIPTDEAAVSPERPLQHLQLLRCESPQADLCRTYPDHVRRLGAPDPDLQPELSRLGIKDLRDVVELFLGERVESPLVDRLSKESGVLGESGSIQADQHHPLAALHRRGVGESGAVVCLFGGVDPDVVVGSLALFRPAVVAPEVDAAWLPG